MVYQALYRKYRPKNFQDVVGQDATVTTLKNSIKSHHIGHAYLFSGPRGTGKTTVAKIFARSVNCLDPIDGCLCANCINCHVSLDKQCMDIIEIDAASNNGVDEIRDLRSKVMILPTALRYKVYIIDEVHMLSIGAFNALLKTLEEPPEHVIFILATTDPQKIPRTIISRCQCYQFKKIQENQIVSHLKNLSVLESITIEDAVLSLIARSCDGGMRDAVGLLDKISSYQANKITVNDFLAINGSVAQEELSALCNAIFSHDDKQILEKIGSYYDDGKDLIQVLKQVMTYLKDALIAYYVHNKQLLWNESEIISFINLINEKMFDIKKADDVLMYVEIMILHFSHQFSNSLPTDESPQIISREIISEKTDRQIISSDVTVNKITNKLQIVNYPDEFLIKFKNLMLIRAKNTMSMAIKEELKKEIDNWKMLEDFTFDQKQGYLACELLDGKLRAASETTVIVSYEYLAMLEKMSQHYLQLIDFYQKCTHSSKNIAFISDEEWHNLKQEYIKLLKDGKTFVYQDEPDLITIQSEETENQIQELEQVVDVASQEAIALFGDIVEVK